MKLPETTNESQLSPVQKLQLEALKKAYDYYEDRIKQWTEVHGSYPPPLVWDESVKEFIWMNRETSRKHARNKR